MLEACAEGKLPVERREAESPPQIEMRSAIASSGGGVMSEKVGAATGNRRWRRAPKLPFMA